MRRTHDYYAFVSLGGLHIFLKNGTNGRQYSRSKTIFRSQGCSFRLRPLICFDLFPLRPKVFSTPKILQMGFEPFSTAPALGYNGPSVVWWFLSTWTFSPFRHYKFKGYPDLNQYRKQPPPINRLSVHSKNHIEYLSRSRSKYKAGG